MNLLDELSGALPKPPASEELPRQQLHKTELLTIIAADRPRRGALRNRATRGWLGPVMAAAAVAAVAALAVTLPSLVGVGSGSPPSSRGAQAGHSTGTTAPSSAAAAALPPGSSRLTRTRHWAVAAASFSAIAVSVTRGPVEVAGGSDSSAAISATPYYRGRAPVLSSQILDGTLTVTVSCPQEPDCQVALTLKVPAGITVRTTADLGNIQVTRLQGSVTAIDRQGDIFLTDLSGRVSASNDLGDISLGSLSGPVTASTRAGTITAVGLLAAQATLTSQEGDITAAFNAPPTQVTASSQLGDVVLTLPSYATYDVIASTQLGSTSVTVPRSAGSTRVIKASSKLGSVTVAG